MPVTVKLSRRFYEVLGDDLANELAEWFNVVDAAYRNEFRDLFEVHFSRFDAKLEQRLAEMKAELRQEIAQRFGALDGRFAEFHAEFVGFQGEIAGRFVGFQGEIARRFAGVQAEIGALEDKVVGRVAKWLVFSWIGAVGAIVGTMIALQRL